METKDLIGKTITEVKEDGDTLTFKFSDGTGCEYYHSQDCCEHVRIEDITGDLKDLVGEPLTMAEEEFSNDDSPGEFSESWTWTFYKFATIKGYVTIRWLGESNGWYSERVDLRELTDGDL